ncbi:uncharacterized protein PHALS_10078 [Plasmopara halstedii]|uniref:RxLR-like protein n=1 Tax=Plasmopara halstedii TaxID=4781 RepID=A0A0P1AG08_PLAHL|nr:uncharacterized protein PHALS_10078 [Plasmopara halstedii]CEG39845.1 hypothetical protein PHALS_10078 [Plasmopara halstedii]|eukprot:XP_024576214.1 hypothetical protein PHALS_10078 [Plasmopara halstedii]
MITLKMVVLASSFALSVGLPQETFFKDMPSVKLHVKFKRESMKFHGQSEFDIYATPQVSVNGSSVLYDCYATLSDNRSNYTYTIKDGAYLTTTDAFRSKTTQCLPPSLMLFNEILPALNNVTPIPSASIGDKAVECTSGNLLKTTFAETNYAICASGKAGFTAYSSDMDIIVEYLKSPISIAKPELSATFAPCEIVRIETSFTPAALALATGGSIPSFSHRQLREESHMIMESSSCNECSTMPRPCIFFHGSGNEHGMDELQDTAELLKDKLGDIHGHAPCCSSIKYAVIETMDAGWRNEDLQQKFCNFSLSMSPTSDVAAAIIENTIVVTHSMGGLVMAGAIANNTCTLSNTSSWVALSPPMTGSMASDYLIDICGLEDSKVRLGFLEKFEQCPAAESRKSTSYQGEKYSDPIMDEAYIAAQKAYTDNVEAAMCSDSYVGIFSKFQAPSIFAGTIVKHKSEENDGLVEFQSCVGGLDTGLFGNHYSNSFYRSRLNHADTAFLTGDGIFRNSQKPNKWFECLKYNNPRRFRL